MNFKIRNVCPISLLLLLLLLVSCSTPYQKLGKRGGYSEEKINDRVYKVSFQGNTRTTDEVVYKYFLRRCAEIALEHHYTHFTIIETEDKSKSAVVTSEGSPKSQKRITTMRYSGSTNYSPTEYKNITKHIIEGKIALFKEGEEPVNAFKVDEVLKDVRY
ncbi:MAG: CC0125/CC1285 family lipoprotein [Bacteriovorax sp.]